MNTQLLEGPITTSLRQMSIEDLRQELKAGLRRTAESLMRVAEVWKELVRRGEDLSFVTNGLAKMLPDIAAGKLSAEAVEVFFGRTEVLKAISRLPTDQQKELCGGKELEVYSPEDKTTIKMPIHRIPVRLLDQVITDTGIRAAEEQKKSLGEAKERATPPRTYRVRVNRKNRTVQVGNVTVAVEEVLAAFTVAAVGKGGVNVGLAAERGEGVPMASCYLTAEESERLDAICKAKKLDRGELVRQAVVSMLLL